MPYKQNQINACFAGAGREKGAKKKKRESGCKKMVKSKHGHKESFESRLNAALFEEIPIKTDEKAKALVREKIRGLLKSGASLKVIAHALKLQPKAVAQLAGAKTNI